MFVSVYPYISINFKTISLNVTILIDSFSFQVLKSIILLDFRAAHQIVTQCWCACFCRRFRVYLLSLLVFRFFYVSTWMSKTSWKSSLVKSTHGLNYCVWESISFSRIEKISVSRFPRFLIFLSIPSIHRFLRLVSWLYSRALECCGPVYLFLFYCCLDAVYPLPCPPSLISFSSLVKLIGENYSSALLFNLYFLLIHFAEFFPLCPLLSCLGKWLNSSACLYPL